MPKFSKMVFLYHHLSTLLRSFFILLLLGATTITAQVLIRYPINQVQTASLLMPNQVAPGLGWDFLTPPYRAALDYGSPRGFLRNGEPGGFLARGWTSNSEHADQYFQFIIQPREHCIVRLESISMSIISTKISHGEKAQALSPQRWEVTVSLSSTPSQKFSVFSETTPSPKNAAQAIFSFEKAGDFSDVPLIIGPDSATFRIYGLKASPLKSNQGANYNVHAVGGLIHTTINEETLGSDLMLHGEIYCKKETHNLLLSSQIENPLLTSLKLQDAIQSSIPLGSLSMIPEPQIASWIGAFIGLLSIALKNRNTLISKKIK